MGRHNSLNLLLRRPCRTLVADQKIVGRSSTGDLVGTWPASNVQKRVTPVMAFDAFGDAVPLEEFAVPGDAEIEAARQRCGWQKVRLEGDTVQFLDPGLSFDSGGVAKGLAVDICSHRLTSKGLQDFMVNLGGNMRCFGAGRNGRSWTVGVRNPFDQGAIVGMLDLTDGMAVATSGNYERFAEKDGKRYAHNTSRLNTRGVYNERSLSSRYNRSSSNYDRRMASNNYSRGRFPSSLENLGRSYQRSSRSRSGSGYNRSLNRGYNSGNYNRYAPRSGSYRGMRPSSGMSRGMSRGGMSRGGMSRGGMSRSSGRRNMSYIDLDNSPYGTNRTFVKRSRGVKDVVADNNGRISYSKARKDGNIQRTVRTNPAVSSGNSSSGSYRGGTNGNMRQSSARSSGRSGGSNRSGSYSRSSSRSSSGSSFRSSGGGGSRSSGASRSGGSGRSGSRNR